MSRPYFSLVLATAGRVEEVRRFLESLLGQSFQDYELIVVDQNSDGRLADLIRDNEIGRTTVLRTAPGLSAARNLGLRHVRGEVVGFPDDDCWYPSQFLERLAEFFQNRPQVDGVTGWYYDPRQRSGPSLPTTPGKVSLLTPTRWGSSHNLFFRIDAIKRVGAFDVNLGLGSQGAWKSGEDTDYVIRSIKAGLAIEYRPDIAMTYHPIKGYRGPDLRRRAAAYSMAMGHLIVRHRLPLRVTIGFLVRPALGALVYVLRGRFSRARLHWSILLGRWRGFVLTLLDRT